MERRHDAGVDRCAPCGREAERGCSTVEHPSLRKSEGRSGAGSRQGPILPAGQAAAQLPSRERCQAAVRDQGRNPATPPDEGAWMDSGPFPRATARRQTARRKRGMSAPCRVGPGAPCVAAPVWAGQRPEPSIPQGNARAPCFVPVPTSSRRRLKSTRSKARSGRLLSSCACASQATALRRVHASSRRCDGTGARRRGWMQATGNGPVSRADGTRRGCSGTTLPRRYTVLRAGDRQGFPNHPDVAVPLVPCPCTYRKGMSGCHSNAPPSAAPSADRSGRCSTVEHLGVRELTLAPRPHPDPPANAGVFYRRTPAQKERGPQAPSEISRASHGCRACLNQKTSPAAPAAASPCPASARRP